MNNLERTWYSPFPTPPRSHGRIRRLTASTSSLQSELQRIPTSRDASECRSRDQSFGKETSRGLVLSTAHHTPPQRVRRGDWTTLSSKATSPCHNTHGSNGSQGSDPSSRDAYAFLATDPFANNNTSPTRKYRRRKTPLSQARTACESLGPFDVSTIGHKYTTQKESNCVNWPNNFPTVSSFGTDSPLRSRGEVRDHRRSISVGSTATFARSLKNWWPDLCTERHHQPQHQEQHKGEMKPTVSTSWILSSTDQIDPDAKLHSQSHQGFHHARQKSRRASMLNYAQLRSRHQRELSEQLRQILDLNFRILGVSDQPVAPLTEINTLIECGSDDNHFENDRGSNERGDGGDGGLSDFEKFQRTPDRINYHNDSVSSTRCMLNIPCARYRLLSAHQTRNTIPQHPPEPLQDKFDPHASNVFRGSIWGIRPLTDDISGTLRVEHTGPSDGVVTLFPREDGTVLGRKISSSSSPFKKSDDRAMSSRKSTHESCPNSSMETSRSSWTDLPGLDSLDSIHARLPSISTISSFSIDTPNLLSPKSCREAVILSATGSQSSVDGFTDFESDACLYEVCETKAILMRPPTTRPILRCIGGRYSEELRS